MEILKGKIESAQKVVVFGPEGIGKSTFASKFPRPIFIDTEGGTQQLDIERFKRPTSWTMLMEQVRYVLKNPSICETLVIDTADWAEMLCIEHVVTTQIKDNTKEVKGLESFGYGKGHVFLGEEWGRLLNLLTDVINAGIHVVFTAHAKMRKFEQPDEMGAYDRWEMKLQKTTAPLLKEWADMVLFANYKTIVVNVDNQGAAKGKNKAQGGSRIMHTTHHPCWDAKNRADLPEELKFDFSEIAHLFKLRTAAPSSAPAEPKTAPRMVKMPDPEPAAQPEAAPPAVGNIGPAPDIEKLKSKTSLPKALIDLMVMNEVAESEIQIVVADRGYYPVGTPIENYDPEFIKGVLIGAWPQVFEMIKKVRAEDLPF